jgi:hypothetical protein
MRVAAPDKLSTDARDIRKCIRVTGAIFAKLTDKDSWL